MRFRHLTSALAGSKQSWFEAEIEEVVVVTTSIRPVSADYNEDLKYHTGWYGKGDGYVIDSISLQPTDATYNPDLKFHTGIYGKDSVDLDTVSMRPTAADYNPDLKFHTGWYGKNDYVIDSISFQPELMINFPPFVSGIQSTYNLTYGQDTVITAVGTDPEGDAITWSFEELRSGGYIVVTSSGDDDKGSNAGAVYVYDANNLSVAPTKLTAFDGAASDQFGAGDVLVTPERLFISSYVKTDSGLSAGGAVYVYDTSDLSADPIKIVPPDQGEWTVFGKRIAVNSNKLVVGAFDGYISTSNGSKGAVYVYDLNDLSADPIKILEDPRGNQHKFGEYMSLNESYLAVGVSRVDGTNDAGNPTVDEGIVYLYDINDLSAAPTEIVPSDLLTNQYTGAAHQFGADIELTSSKLFVGAVGDDDLGIDTGAVYVYDLNDLSAEPTKLTAFDGSSPPTSHGRDNFGDRIVANENFAVIAAHRKTMDGQVYQGAVYVFDLSDLSAQPTQLYVGDDGDSEFEFFGSDVAITDDHVIVGSSYSENQAGSTYVYDLNDLSAAPTKLTAFDGGYRDFFGIRVSANTAPASSVTITQSDNTFTVTPTAEMKNADFNLRITATDTEDNTTSVTTNIIYVNQPPVIAGVDSTYELTQGQDTVITAVGTDPEGDAITWSFEEVLGSGVFVKSSYDTYLYNPSTMELIETIQDPLIMMTVGGGKLAGKRGNSIRIYDLNDLSTHEVEIQYQSTAESIAITDNHLIVGHPSLTNNRGAIWVFDLNDLGSGTVDPYTVNKTVLTSPNSAMNRDFGENIVVSGNKLICSQSTASGQSYGILVVYDLDDLSASPTVLNASATLQDCSIAAFGTHFVVGIPFEYNGSQANSGAAYIYDTENLSAAPISVPLFAIRSAKFGRSVALSSDHVIVQKESDRSVWVFDRNNLSANPAIIYKPSNTGYEFGSDLAVSGDRLFVGDKTENNNTGKLYVYDFADLSSGTYLYTGQGTSHQISGSNTYVAFSDNMVGYVSSSALNGVTITQSDNVFTVTPGTQDASFTLNIKATDSEGNSTKVTPTFDYEIPVPVVNDTSVGRIIAAASNNNYSNKLYAFDLDGSNEKELFIPAGMDNDSQFGADENMAIDGTILVVGQRTEQRVFVYDLATTNEPIEITPSAPSTLFGTSVAISDGKIIVGTYEGGSGLGEFYIYDLDGSNEIKVTEPSAGLPGAGSQNGWTKFGWKVAAGHGRIVVGAPMADADGVTDSGQVYIYDMQGTFINTISATDGQTESDQFGDYEIAIGNGKIAVTAFIADGGSINSFAGSVYLYDLDGSNEVRLYDPALTSVARFGTGLAIGHEKVVVGSDNAAHFYIFDLDGSNMQKIASTNNTRISVANNRIVVGDYGKNAAETSSGELRVYDMSGNLLNTIHQSNPTNRAFLGSSLAMYDTADARAHNFAPTVTGIDAAYTLTQGQDTVITAAATDPEGDAITWSFEEQLSVSLTSESFVRNSYAPYKFADPGSSDRPGKTVKVSGDIVAISNTGYSSYGGAVFLFNHQTGQLINRIEPDSTSGSQFLGASIAFGDDIVVSGGEQLAPTGGTQAGGIVIADLNGNKLQSIYNPSGSNGEKFGFAVTVTTDRIVVGAHGRHQSGNQSGAIRIYDKNTYAEIDGWIADPQGAVEYAKWGEVIVSEENKVVVASKSSYGKHLTVYPDITDYQNGSFRIDFDGVNEIADVEISNDKIYVSDQRTIFVYDATTGNRLSDVVSYSSSQISEQISVSDGYLILNHNSGEMRIYDLSTNALAGSYNPSEYSYNYSELGIGFGSGKVFVADYNDSKNVNEYNVLSSALNGTTVTQSDNVFTVTPGTQDASFTLNIKATDSNGNTATVPATVNFDYVNQAPTVTGIQSAYTLTQGQDTVITAAATDPEGDAITWSFEEVKSGSSYIAVGAPLDDVHGTNSGSVYVYDANNLSVRPTKLSPVSGNYGASMFMTSTKLYVGAYSDDTGGNNFGSAYVYDLSDLSAAPTILSPSTASDNVGWAISATETHVVVSAINDDTKTTNAGAVYVYDASNLGATPTKLVTPDGGSSDQFGRAVHIDSNNVYVGCRQHGSYNHGAVYVYSLSDLSAAPTKLEDGTDYLQLGCYLASDDTNLYVGAMGYNGRKGAVFAYALSDLSAAPTIITESDLTSNSYFGERVDARHGSLVVGAERKSENGNAYQGAVYVYDTSDLSAAPTKLTAPDDGDTESEYFGQDISINEDSIVIGANMDDGRNGSVWVYDRNDLSAAPTKLFAFDAAYDDRFGWAVAAVSAPSQLNGVTVTQSDNVFTVTPGTADADFQLRITATDSEGNATSATSDFDFTYVNQAPSVTGIQSAYTLTQGQDTVITAVGTDPEGDAIAWSYEEVISGTNYVVVSAAGDDDNGSNSGSVYVFDANNLSAQPTKLTAFDGAAGDSFGRHSSLNSNILAVTSYGDDDGQPNSGSVYVYDLNNLSATPTKLTAYDMHNQAGDKRFGERVLVTEDQIIVGNSWDDQEATYAGAVYVFDINNLNAQPTKLTAYDGAVSDNFGYRFATTADKILVGSFDDDHGNNSGAVYVFDKSDLSVQPTKLVSPDASENQMFGISIEASSSQVVIGARGDNSNTGTAYVYDANDLSATPTKLTAYDGATSDMFGQHVAISSDKVVVSAYADDDRGAQSGSVYVFDANDLSAQPTKLTAFDGAATDMFGTGLAVTSEQIIVGAYGGPGSTYTGVVYVYDINDLSAQPTRLTAYDGAGADYFGYSVSANNLSSQLNGVTVTQSDNVFTVTPAQQDATFQLTFKATDSNGNVTSTTSDFDFTYVNQAPSLGGIEPAYTLTQGVNEVIVPVVSDAEGETVTMSYEEVLGEGVPSGMNGTTVTQNGNDFTVTPGQQDANFTLRFTATDESGNQTNFDSEFTLDYNDAPSITGVDSSYTLDQGQDTEITVTTSDSDGDTVSLTYAVTSGDLSGTTVTQAGNVFTITPGDQDATFQLTFTATDTNGAATTATSDITFDYNAAPVITGIESVYTLTQGVDEVIVGMSSDADGDAVTWSFAEVLNGGVPSGLNGTAITQNGGEFTVTPGTADANFTIRFTLTDTAGNTDTRDADFSLTYVNQAPSVTGIDSTYTLTQGQGTVITAAATDPEGDTVTWSYEAVSSTSQDQLFVSAIQSNSYQGYVYVYNPTDLTEEPTLLTAPNGSSAERFGFSMEIDSDKIYIGEMMSDESDETWGGAVYIYDRSDLSAAPTMLTGEAQNNLRFGSGISVTDDLLIIGAYGWGPTTNSNDDYTGKVYIYNKSDLSLQATLTPTNGDHRDYFGLGGGITVTSNHILIGSMGDDDNSTDAGAVYVYDVNTYAFVQKLTAPDASESDRFGGYSIKTYGGKIYISAVTADHNSNGTSGGAVYVYNESDLSFVEKLVAFDAAEGDYFGMSVLPHEDKLFVGAHQRNSSAGAIYVYNINNLSAAPTVLESPATGAMLGYNTTIIGDKLYSSAHRKDASTGGMYVYILSDLSAAPELVNPPAGTGTSISFGFNAVGSVAPSPLGDVTVAQSDNVFTVTPGQQDADFQLTFKATDSEGNVTSVSSDFDFTYVNQAPSVTGIESSYLLTAGGSGTAITAVGTDPEGDAITWSYEEVASGSSYVVVGAWGDGDNGSSSGSVYVYDANNLSATPTKLTAFDAAAGDCFGENVFATADKIIVGARLDDDNGSQSGSVYVYDANNLSATPTKLTAFDGAAGDFFGISIATAADKIIVGAYGEDSYTGSVYVYDINNLSAQPTKLTAFDGAANDKFGYSITTSSDKIVVGANGDDFNGSVYVYDANDLSAQPTKLTAFDGASFDSFG